MQPNLSIAFYDMIAGMVSNKNLNQIATKLIIIWRKLYISIVFITQFYYAVPKDFELNCTHFSLF